MQMQNLLLTGGTGSFGRAFIARVLRDHPECERIVVYSRDELKQSELQQTYPRDQFPQMRFLLGNVRDADRLRRAMEGIDTVVHAAALKQVPAAEYNPLECIRTNVNGAENVVSAALANNVKNVVALSTDKACSPINLYGASKLCSDKIFIAANNMRGPRDVRFSVVRYGNVMGSRGSVVPFFLNHREKGFLPITDARMTRFNILLEEGVDLVQHALQSSIGGELYIKKIPSFSVTDLAEAVAPGCEQRIVGIRPGEKLHEEMLTSTDSMMTLETDDHYIVVPQNPFGNELDRFAEHHAAGTVPEGFVYASDTNKQWLDVDQLRFLITRHMGVNLKPRAIAA